MEARIGRLLFVGTVVGVALLLIGVVLMGAHGIDPSRGSYAAFDVTRVLPDLLAGRPEGFLWAGIMVVIATPVARVLGELSAFLMRRDGPMAVVAFAILGIIGLSVALAIVLEA